MLAPCGYQYKNYKMPKPETIILEVKSELDVPEAFDRLCTDLLVGGFVLEQFIEDYELDRLTRVEGKGFSDEPNFSRLFRLLAEHVSDESTDFSTQEAGSFTWSHDWHLSVRQDQPCVRFWVHLRDEAEIFLARARDFNVRSGLGFTDEEVEGLAFARPVKFAAKPGDIVGFIDRSTEGVTGTSTFHKVEVPDSSPPGARLSVACDLTFMNVVEVRPVT